MQELNEMDDDSTDVWKENWFDKYEKRPEDLNNVNLAQFFSKYYKNNKGIYVQRQEPRIIRYRNYDIEIIHAYYNDYRHILEEDKYIQIYEENTNLILERRKEFESNLDVEKTLQICRELCRENDDSDNESEVQNVAAIIAEANPFEQLYHDPHSDVNINLRLETLNKLVLIAKKRKI